MAQGDERDHFLYVPMYLKARRKIAHNWLASNFDVLDFSALWLSLLFGSKETTILGMRYETLMFASVAKLASVFQCIQLKTSIRTGNKRQSRIFSLIDKDGYVMRGEGE